MAPSSVQAPPGVGPGARARSAGLGHHGVDSDAAEGRSQAGVEKTGANARDLLLVFGTFKWIVSYLRNTLSSSQPVKRITQLRHRNINKPLHAFLGS